MIYKTGRIGVGSDPHKYTAFEIVCSYARRVTIFRSTAPTAELWRNHLLPSNRYCGFKIVAIATYANVQATLQGESLRVKAGLGKLLS